MRKELAFLAIALILMIFLARMLAVPQQIRLNKELVQLKVRGPASSVAIAKSLAGVRVAVLIAEKDGTILEAYRVKGWSIASGYALDAGFHYRDCYEAKRVLESKGKLTTQERAYLSAADYLVKGLDND